MPTDSPSSPLPSDEDILRVAGDLTYIEEWARQNNVALSALGRTALDGDQAAIYRWRKKGITGCSPAKRRLLAIYILQHPNGIPGYTKAKTGRKKHGNGGHFVPGGTTPASSTTGSFKGQAAPSTSIPVPSTELVEEHDLQYVKQIAFAAGKSIAVVLAEMVTLGIACHRENMYEEAETLKEQQKEEEKFNGNSSKWL